MRHFITYLNFAIITITITLMGCADTTTVTQTNTSTANNQSNSRGQSLVVKTEKGKAAEYILGEYIVVFNEQGVGLPSKQAAQQAIEKTQEIFQKYQIHRDSLIFQYQHLLKGFAVKLSRGQLRKLKNDPRVDHISKNYLFKLNVPVSISRDKELSKGDFSCQKQFARFSWSSSRS